MVSAADTCPLLPPWLLPRTGASPVLPPDLPLPSLLLCPLFFSSLSLLLSPPSSFPPPLAWRAIPASCTVRAQCSTVRTMQHSPFAGRRPSAGTASLTQLWRSDLNPSGDGTESWSRKPAVCALPSESSSANRRPGGPVCDETSHAERLGLPDEAPSSCCRAMDPSPASQMGIGTPKKQGPLMCPAPVCSFTEAHMSRTRTSIVFWSWSDLKASDKDSTARAGSLMKLSPPEPGALP